MKKIIIVLLLVVVGLGGYYYYNHYDNKEQPIHNKSVENKSNNIKPVDKATQNLEIKPEGDYAEWNGEYYVKGIEAQGEGEYYYHIKITVDSSVGVHFHIWYEDFDGSVTEGYKMYGNFEQLKEKNAVKFLPEVLYEGEDNYLNHDFVLSKIDDKYYLKTEMVAPVGNEYGEILISKK
ncbi:hypothetical protein [Chryseobacterium oryctis]|uniref:DUF4352 domain-containing protein n=1 Tax=Chryseobacterium oryctis TaxID=2952618 RepID=A0ABT3HMX3_9FLAO|nr:hypothetical protein [Chryseobacterium oryctis]MCW3161104.1 hypothetical protein [Chryseobacterium oryctis]